MKILKPALFVTMLFLAAINTQAQEIKEYVTVNITMNVSIGNCYIIVYPDGKTEKGDLKNGLPKNVETNGITYNNIFNQLAKKGYKLVSSNGGDSFTNYIFEKL